MPPPHLKVILETGELVTYDNVRRASWLAMLVLRQFMYNMDEIESMELMLKNMKSTKNNVEFFDMMRRGG